VFDPAASPPPPRHYEVLWTPHEPMNPKHDIIRRNEKLAAGGVQGRRGG